MKFPFKLRSECKFDVIGFGTNAVDYLVRVPSYPEFNSKVELTSYELAAGGEVASTLTGLQRLGMRTAYAGRFGGDREGEFGRGSLAAEGVDLSFAETLEGVRTQVGFIIIDERSGERTVIWHRDEGLAYRAADPADSIAVDGRILHLTPHDTEACIRLAGLARSNGVVVSLDVDRPVDGIQSLLPLVDICIGSSDFALQLFGIDDPAAGLGEIASRFGCGVVGLTLGESGSIFLCGGKLIETTAFQVPGPCVDTTGAGDAFRAGFLYGILTDSSVEDSAKFANAVAALKCRTPGARTGLPRSYELHSFVTSPRH